MGFLDKLTGVRHPDDGVAAVPATELTQRLLAMNADDRPYEIRAQGNEVVAEWRIADAHWRQLIGSGSFRETYKLALQFDEGDHVVKAKEQSREASVDLGVGEFSAGTSRKRNGVTVKRKMTIRVPGQEPYHFEFDADELRDPVRDAVTAAGWAWKPKGGWSTSTSIGPGGGGPAGGPPPWAR